MSTNEILRELISFLEAGYSLNTSLELLTKITEDARILQLKQFLSEGQTLEEAFSKLNWDPLFLEYFIFFLRSGQLKEALQQSLNILEMKKSLTTNLMKSLAYPTILFLFAMIFTFFFSFFLLPQVEVLYSSFNQEPNIAVVIFFKMMNIFPIILFFLILIFALYLNYYFTGLKRGNFNVVEKALQNRLFGSVLKEYFSLKFALYYREASQHSHRLAQILDLLSRDLFQSDLIMVVYDLKKEILRGTELSNAIQRSIYFTNYFKQIFTLSLYASSVEKQLDHYIQFSFARIHSKVSQWTKRLVPALYAFSMGTVVSIYLMIILPMMNLVSNI